MNVSAMFVGVGVRQHREVAERAETAKKEGKQQQGPEEQEDSAKTKTVRRISTLNVFFREKMDAANLADPGKKTDPQLFGELCTRVTQEYHALTDQEWQVYVRKARVVSSRKEDGRPAFGYAGANLTRVNRALAAQQAAKRNEEAIVDAPAEGPISAIVALREKDLEEELDEV